MLVMNTADPMQIAPDPTQPQAPAPVKAPTQPPVTSPTPTATAQPATPPAASPMPVAQPAGSSTTPPPLATNDPLAFGPPSGVQYSPVTAATDAPATPPAQSPTPTTSASPYAAPSGGASDLPATPPTQSPTPTAQSPIPNTAPIPTGAPANAPWVNPYGVAGTPSGSASGLPTGWTTGSQNMGDAGDAYYNGQSVNQVTQNPDGTYTLGLNAPNGLIGGGATNSQQNNVTVSAAQYQQIMGALNSNLSSQPYQGYQNEVYSQLLSDPTQYAAELGGSGLPGTAQNFANQAGAPSFLQDGQMVDANGNPITSSTPGQAAPSGGASDLTPTDGDFGLGTGLQQGNVPPLGLAPPTGQQATPTGGATDVPPGTTQAPNTSAASASNPITSLANGTGLGYTTSATDPNNALSAQTITPDPSADFMANAKAQYAAWQQQTDPQYQADLKSANQYGFGSGRGYSGILNNSLGDLAAQRSNAQLSNASNFLSQALGQENANQYANIGIAQQQQGFQNTQQQEAFSNYLEELLAGSQGDPAQTDLALSQIYGGQAGNATNAAGNLINSQNAANGSGLTAAQINAWLAQNGYPPVGTGSTPPAAPPIDTGTGTTDDGQ